MLRVQEEALTFDDVLLVPGESEVVAKDVSLKTRLTRDITLNIPLMSAAMDTVTESELAIAMAQEGGIGIVHKNMTHRGAGRRGAQGQEVRERRGARPDHHPLRTAPIRDLIRLTIERNFSGVPVLNRKRELVGIVTRRDVRFATDLDEPVSSIMTPKRELVTVHEGTDLAEVKQLLHQHRIEKVLVVNDAFDLRGMITVEGHRQGRALPDRLQGRLWAPAGRCLGRRRRRRHRRARGAPGEAGVDVLVVDTAHGHSRNVIDTRAQRSRSSIRRSR